MRTMFNHQPQRLLGEIDYLPTPEEEELFISQYSSEEDDRLEASRGNDKWGRYTKYLQSSHWQSLRAQVLNRDKCCQHCWSDLNLQVHHLSYRGLGNEGLSDLITLCEDCHAQTHKAKG